jgi:hypothetical protein
MPIDFLSLSWKRLRRFSYPTLPSPLQRIPDELLEQILAFCSQSDTARVYSTCWRLARVAVRVLYRHVKPATSEKAHDLFITLCFHKHLLPFIHSCEMHVSLRIPKAKLPLDESDFSKRIRKLGTLRTFHCRHVLRDPLTLVASVLKKMDNLIRLELLVPEREVNLGYSSRLFTDCCFQLRYLDTNIRFDTGMAHFLGAQSSLEDLRVYTSAPLSSMDVDIFTKSSLSSLTSLSWTSRMPTEVVRVLTKGKSIHKVNISICADVRDISPIIAFGPASNRIKTANFTFRDLRHPTFVQLEAMSFHFPNLVGLGIAVYSFSDVRPFH